MMQIGFRKILSTIVDHEREFFPKDIPRPLKELYTTTAILNFAMSAGFIFEPIYLYTLGFSLSKIMLFYLLVYVLYFFLIPLGGKVVKHKGFEHGIMYGSVFFILYLIFLINIPQHEGFFFLAALAFALQKTLFWPGFHADFAYFGKTGQRAREVSFLVILDSLVFILGPLAGGLVVSALGFPALFIFMCAAILISNIPLLTTREVFIPTDMSYRGAYKRLVAKENRRHFWGYIGFGEELIFFTIWPIFIFVTINNFFGTGFAVALSTCVTALVVLYVGKFSDSKDRKKVLRFGAILVVLSWLMRLFIQGGAGVLFTDFFSRVSKHVFGVPMVSGLYEYAAKHSIVRTIIFFEMSLTVGKVAVAGLLAIIFAFAKPGWEYAFILAAFFSLFYFVLGVKRPPPILNGQ
ncbi:MAG: MFS transporter [bacterium]|nr:MFS transporter [bacterium]